MKIEYVTGDATTPIGAGGKIIVHICNDQGGWGAGFVLAISKKWKEPEENYRNWYRNRTEFKGDDAFELGNVQIVATSDKDIFVANMIAQHGFGGIAVKYDMLRKCLGKVAIAAKEHNAIVAMPLIGTGLAGGSWNLIEPIIEDELCKKNVTVTVYRFGQ